MSVYLEDNPNPNLSQYRPVRRAAPTGAIVTHTAENATDVNPPDTGAEAVARYISTRTNYGSYHSIVDSDSTIHVGRYEWEMFHEGSGGNRWSLGLAWACQAHQWLNLDSSWVSNAIENGAIEAATMAAWVKATEGITIPARRITPAQYRAGQPGFITHAELDPGRRSDPGPNFPWDLFLERFAFHTSQTPDYTPPKETPPMSTEHCVPANREPIIKESQQVLADAGFYDGVIDGDWYTASNAGLHALKNAYADTIVRLGELANYERDHGELEAELTAVEGALELANVRIGGLQAQIVESTNAIAARDARIAELETQLAGGLTDEQALKIQVADNLTGAIAGASKLIDGTRQ